MCGIRLNETVKTPECQWRRRRFGAFIANSVLISGICIVYY